MDVFLGFHLGEFAFLSRRLFYFLEFLGTSKVGLSLKFPGLSGGGLVTVVGCFDGLINLFFIRFGVTVFCLNNFGREDYVNFKSLILARALGHLIGLESLFPKIGKSGAECFSVLVLGHNIDDQCKLFGGRDTLGKF